MMGQQKQGDIHNLGGKEGSDIDQIDLPVK